MGFFSIVNRHFNYMATRTLTIRMILPLPTPSFSTLVANQFLGVPRRTVARSSTEAEYRSVTTMAAKLRWVSNLLDELGLSSTRAPVIYCDNVDATNLYSNPVFHSRMKHDALDYHFICEQVQNDDLHVTHVAFADQLANTLTKPLPYTRFH